MSVGANGSATVALSRLRSDRECRRLASSRANLDAVGQRLEMAARAVLTQGLVERMRTDRRFAPALQGLMRISLRH